MRILVAMTGASGALYGIRVVERLVDENIETLVVISPRCRQVLALEHDIEAHPSEWLRGTRGGVPQFLGHQDMAASAASGSSAPDAMVVVPCSMGTVARITAGISTNLIERAADVMLKERRPLVIVPRETPLSTLHLRNLTTLSELGARIVPAMPAFYAKPESVDDLISFVADRAIAAAGIDLPVRSAWTPPGRKTTEAQD